MFEILHHHIFVWLTHIDHLQPVVCPKFLENLFKIAIYGLNIFIRLTTVYIYYFAIKYIIIYNLIIC